jgi:Flp pilus assembly protein TadD
MYLPLMAFVALGVVSVRWMIGRVGGAQRTAGVAVLLTLAAATALGARTIARNRDYRSELELSYTVRDNWPGRIGYHMVGLSLIKLGRYEEAVAGLREAASEYPNARYDLGTALYRLGRRQDAIAELEAFIAAEPRLYASSAARTLIGRMHLADGRADDGIRYLRAAVTSEPPDPEAHGALADALLDRQAYAEAVEHYRAYLAVFPNQPAAYTGLGVALAASNRVAEAVEAFARRVALEPANARARENLATALLEAGRAREAQAEAERIIGLAASAPVGYDLLGQALAQQGQIEQARAAFSRALQIDPAYAPARAGLARLPR